MRLLLVDADFALLAMMPVHFLGDLELVGSEALLTDLSFFLGARGGNAGVQEGSGEPGEIDEDDIEGEDEEEGRSFF